MSLAARTLLRWNMVLRGMANFISLIIGFRQVQVWIL